MDQILSWEIGVRRRQLFRLIILVSDVAAIIFSDGPWRM